MRPSDTAVARLQREVRELRAALDGSEDAASHLDVEGRIRAVNAAFCRLLGYAPEDVLGRSWEDIVAAGSRDAVRDDLEGAVRVRRDARGVRRDGGEIEVQLIVVPLPPTAAARAGRRGHYLFLRDVGERRRMESQLVRAGRLASVGTLTAGVAHEINNPLAYIVANIDFARNQLTQLASRAGAPGGDLRHALGETGEALTEARQGAERVRNIVRDLRVFARADEEATGPIALRRVLDSSINIAWNEIRHRARLVKDYAETPMVDASESRLGQVFLNVLLNAAHAIPEGEIERNEIRVSTRTDGRGFAVVEVRDSGGGIAADTRARIFDPFFTTKPPSEGTGLGLWICQGILSGLGGSISVDSEPGHGSMFRIELPPVASGAAAAPPAEAIPAAEPPGGRLLIVDDEPMILGALRRAFAASYQVNAASDGRRALDRLRAGERFEVILCDLMMPQMTGMDFHAALIDIDPEQAARVVFVTGGAFTVRARAFLDRVPNARIEKPIDFHSLQLLLGNLRRAAT